jgi:rhodanese-related sulfurtransferase/predicted small lipoprotein YifL
MEKTICAVLVIAFLLSLSGCFGKVTLPIPESKTAAAETAVPAATQAPVPDKTGTPAVPEKEPSGGSREDQLREAEKLLSGEAPVQVLDVRDPEAFEAGHLPHAMLLSADRIGKELTGLLPLKNTVLLVCGDGSHPASEAAEAVKSLGYLFVNELDGLEGWTGTLETGAWTDPADKKQDFSSFIAADLDGLWVDETVFAGHDLTMINLWATFCGPCLSEMPDLKTLHEAYADQGFQVIGIVVDALNPDGSIPMSQVEQARGIVRQTGADYLHLLPTEQLVKAKVDQVMYVPETIFVNSKGEIVGESFIGSHSKEEWEGIIRDYLDKVKQ